MENFILNSSKGLVEISKGQAPIVQFIHGSVCEYLLEQGLSVLHPNTTATDFRALSQDRLEQCCHKYVLKTARLVLRLPELGMQNNMSPCFRKTRELRDRTNDCHPFLEYALTGIISHANAACLLGVQWEHFLDEFPLTDWMRLHNMMVSNPVDRLSPRVGLEYVLVTKNAVGLIESMFRDTKPVRWETTEERYHSLLGAAVANGHVAMAELLLGQGADRNSSVRGSHKCLDVATMRGDTNMVRAILAGHVIHKEIVPGLQETYLSPLHVAAESGFPDIVSNLLTHLDYEDDWDSHMGYVLEAAIYRRDNALMKVLYDKLTPERRDIIRIMNPMYDRDDFNSVSKALHSFRIYYQHRGRYRTTQFALLEKIHSIYKDLIDEPYRLTELAAKFNSTLVEATRKQDVRFRNAVADTATQLLLMLQRNVSRVSSLIEPAMQENKLETPLPTDVIHAASALKIVSFLAARDMLTMCVPQRYGCPMCKSYSWNTKRTKSRYISFGVMNKCQFMKVIARHLVRWERGTEAIFAVCE